MGSLAGQQFQLSKCCGVLHKTFPHFDKVAAARKKIFRKVQSTMISDRISCKKKKKLKNLIITDITKFHIYKPDVHLYRL